MIKRFTMTSAVCMLLGLAAVANAGPVGLGQWYEFGFGAPVGPATKCTAATCVPSSGGNSVFADDPPWTFTAPAAGAVLTVTDAFRMRDQI